MPNKLSQFWQELKRRNVVRVITVYAASAFVILELVDIITEPFGLPGWTLKFVVVILAAGLIVAIILSWIYDIHPKDGKVKTEPANKLKAEEIPKPSNSWKIASYISFVVIAGLILLNVIPGGKDSETLDNLEISIAVLPFDFYSLDYNAADIGDAFSNEIITQLYKISGFDRIISHTSTMQYKGSNKPSIVEIGKALNANYIIEGSLERQNDNVSIQIQVIESLKDNHLWAEEFKGEWKDIFTIRADIAKKVASQLKTILTSSEIDQIEKRPTDNLEAYDLYLLGNQYKSRRTEEGFVQSIELYESAIQLDTGFAHAFAGLSDSYSSLFWYANWMPEVVFEKARVAAQKALELDQELAEAYTALGYIQLVYDWDFESAEVSIRKALELNPNLAIAHYRYSILLNNSFRFDDALFHNRKAVELDPNADLYESYYGISLQNTGQTDMAIQYLKRRIEAEPEYVGSYYLLGFIYCFKEEYDNAILELEKAVSLNNTAQPYRFYLGIAYARAGMPEKTRMQLTELDKLETDGRTVSFGRAVLFAELGEVDTAIYYLQKAYEERNQFLLYMRQYTVMFAPIRSDQRFQEIYHKIWPENP